MFVFIDDKNYPVYTEQAYSGLMSAIYYRRAKLRKLNYSIDRWRVLTYIKSFSLENGEEYCIKLLPIYKLDITVRVDFITVRRPILSFNLSNAIRCAACQLHD